MCDNEHQPHLQGISRSAKHDGCQYTECFWCGEVFPAAQYDNLCPGCAYDCSKIEWVEDL